MVPVKVARAAGPGSRGKPQDKFQVLAVDAEGVSVRERSVFIVR